MQLKFKKLTSFGRNELAGKNLDPVFKVLGLNLCSTTSCFEHVSSFIPSFLISKVAIILILICNAGEKLMFVECLAWGLITCIK